MTRGRTNSTCCTSPFTFATTSTPTTDCRSLVEARATYEQRRVDLNEALWFLKLLAEGLPKRPEETVDASTAGGGSNSISGQSGSSIIPPRTDGGGRGNGDEAIRNPPGRETEGRETEGEAENKDRGNANKDRRTPPPPSRPPDPPPKDNSDYGHKQSVRSTFVERIILKVIILILILIKIIFTICSKK